MSQSCSQPPTMENGDLEKESPELRYAKCSIIMAKTALVDAVITDNLPEMRVLFQRGYLASTGDSDGNTLLHIAVTFKSLSTLDYLLNSGVSDVNAQNRHGWTPLFVAAAFVKREPVVRRLVAAGARVGVGTGEYSSALDYLVRNGSVPVDPDERLVAAYLMDRRAPLSAAAFCPATDAYLAELERASSSRNKRPRLASPVPPAGLMRVTVEMPLHVAVLRGPRHVAALAGGGAPLELKDDDGNTALHVAALHDRQDAAQVLAEAGADVDARNHYGVTPLHLAVGYGGDDEDGLGALLIGRGARLDTRDYEGRTALHWAVSRDQPNMVMRLIMAGADVNCRDNLQATPLFMAITRDPDRGLGLANMLICYGADLTVRARGGYTLVHHALTERRYDCVELLLSLRADANGRDDNGRAPLHVALRDGPFLDASILGRLLGAGAEADAQDARGRTPLHLVLDLQRTKRDRLAADCVALLAQAGARADLADGNGDTALHKAVKRRRSGLLPALLRCRGEVNARDASGNTLLHLLCECTSVIKKAVLKEMMRKGADLDIRNYVGETALHVAVRRRCCKIATALLYYNADACAINAAGYTPFMEALRMEDRQMQLLLLDYETDFDRITEEGCSTLYLAATKAWPMVPELLDRGASVFSCRDDILLAISEDGSLPNIDVFKAICERIPWVNFRWSRNHTALTYAVCSGNIEMFECLLDNGNLRRMIQESYGFRWPSLHDWDLQDRLVDFTLSHFPRNKAVAMIYTLLSEGYEPNYQDAELVFHRFGFGRLFKLLLEMDLRGAPLSYELLLPAIVLDVSKTVRQHIDNFIEKMLPLLGMCIVEMNMLTIVPFCVDTKLFDALRDSLGVSLGDSTSAVLQRTVPSLEELSRNRAREVICKRNNLKSYAEFRRFVRRMNLGIYGDVLNFARPVYKYTPSTFCTLFSMVDVLAPDW